MCLRLLYYLILVESAVESSRHLPNVVTLLSRVLICMHKYLLDSYSLRCGITDTHTLGALAYTHILAHTHTHAIT